MAKFFIQDLNFEKDIGANGLSLTFGPFHFVIDSGMDPKRLGNDALPNFDLLPTGSVDFIVLTHCHLDHLGGVPILAKKQPQAQILVSYANSLLAPLMLENSYSVMCRQKEEKSIPEYPLFTKDDIAALTKRFFVLKDRQTYSLEKEGHTAQLTIFAAGHVLGASSILIDNVTVKDMNIYGCSCGGLVGKCDGAATLRIYNSSVKGKTASGDTNTYQILAYNNAGGIVGELTATGTATLSCGTGTSFKNHIDGCLVSNYTISQTRADKYGSGGIIGLVDYSKIICNWNQHEQW